MEPDDNSKASTFFIAAAVSCCMFQIFWFGWRCFNQIDYDGMAYVGIARHLCQGEFHAAINAFRSPLLSWLIAAAAFGRAAGSAEYVHIGKLINIAAFLLCVAFLYVLTGKLWHSRLVASVAILLLALGRSLAVSAVEMITPDFLFAAITLLYFIVLLHCLRDNRKKDWFCLGCVHGLAFLTKAFALPWLALCTLLAVLLTAERWKIKIARLSLAALIPVIVAAGWATVLHSKYGVFTTGTQFKANLLQWTLRSFDQRRDSTYSVLRDTTKSVDEYLVDDPMPPGSWPWKYHVGMATAFPRLILAEERNIPQVFKETAIVATPGALLAFIAALAILARRRSQYYVEWRFALVVTASALSLVFTYSMLVFDGRYLFPLIPLVLAVAARFLVPDREFDHDGWRKLSIALVVLGSLVALVYPASPFRLLTRDFQSSCYDAGNRLRAHTGSTVVSIGSGPSPEHGVGWEAGYKASFFGRRKLIGTTNFLPDSSQLSGLFTDISKANPDAILVWGRPDDAKYVALTHKLFERYPNHTSAEVLDPALGQVGMLLFTR